MSLSKPVIVDAIIKEETGNDFVPGYTPEPFPDMPQLEMKSPQMMALDMEIMKADIADLTARLERLENGNS